MWMTPTNLVINANDPYTGTDGTQYPGAFPKEQVPGLAIVIETPPPAITQFQTATQSGHELIAGQWHQSWVIADLTQDQIEAAIEAQTKQYIADATNAVQRLLDTSAQAKGYDDIKSAALRAGYAGPFHDEGQKFATWMDACWATCYSVMGQVLAGERAKPTLEELITELPELIL